MNIAFDNPRHERLVNAYDALCRRYNRKKGVDSASAILSAMDVLRSADSLADVPRAFRPHPLKGGYKGCFAVDVDEKNRVRFKPNHGGDTNYRIDNYKTIKNICIIELFKDYH